MTDSERDEVRRALELDDHHMAAAVAKLSTADQLHQFLASYNVNDGLLPCLAIARHPQCDAGTALWLYWQFSDCLFEPSLRAGGRGNEPAWNEDAVLTELEHRLDRADFRSAVFYFDPREWLHLTESTRCRLVAAGVPDARFVPIGSRRVERDSLL